MAALGQTPLTMIHRNPVIALAVTSLAAAAQAQTGPGLLLGAFPPEKNAVVNADAAFFFVDQSDADQDFSLSTYSASGRFKLDLDRVVEGINRAQPRAGFDFYTMQMDDDAGVLPDNLTDMSIAFGMGVYSDDKWVAGLTVGIGYAGENLFNDGDAYYGLANFLVGYTIDDMQSLGFVLNYDGNRTFLPDVPLPGLFYTRRMPDRGLVLTVGFPFSEIEWTPHERWTFKLRYYIPETITGEVAYNLTDNWSIYAGIDSQSRAFHDNDLANNLDRIIFSQTTAEIGVRGELCEAFSITLAGGYAFNQDFEVGFDSRDSDDLLELDDAPFVRVSAEWRF